MPKVEIRRREIPALGKGYVLWNVDDDEPVYRNLYLSIPEAVADVNKANAANVTSMLPGMPVPEDLWIVATCDPWPRDDEDELDVYGINRRLQAYNEAAAKAFVEEVDMIIEEMREEVRRVITPADIERIAHLLAGDETGWQTRFGAMTGLSRSYVSKVLSGDRPVTQEVAVRIIDAAQLQAQVLRDRADELDQVLAMLMPKPGEPLPPKTDEGDEG